MAAPPPPTPPAAPSSGLVRRAILVIGLVSVVLFWLALLLGDEAIAPVRVIELSGTLFVAVAVVHVVSAPIAWFFAVRTASVSGRRRQVLFGLVVVPLCGLATFGVMLSNAVVWRDDLGAWLGPVLVALAGPVALGILLATALRPFQSATADLRGASTHICRRSLGNDMSVGDMSVGKLR